MKTFKRIWRGAFYLEGYGSHPGNFTMGMMFVLCGIAGVKGGFWGFMGGGLFGLAGMLPAYMIGCHSRARDYERDVERTFQVLQKEQQ